MMTSTALQCGDRKPPFVEMVQNATERDAYTEGCGHCQYEVTSQCLIICSMGVVEKTGEM